MSDPFLTVFGVAFAVAGFDVVMRVDERVSVLPKLPDDETETLRSDLWKWVFAGLIVGFVLVVEGRNLASIGVEPMAPLALVGWTVGGVVGTVVFTGIAYLTYERFGLTTPEGFVAEQARRPASARAFTALTAGVTETVLFQAYPIERLAPLLGSLPAAAAVSFLAFTGVHYVGDTFSLQETVYIGVPALCMTVLWVLTGNFLVVATAHAAVDGLSLLSADADASNGTASPDPG